MQPEPVLGSLLARMEPFAQPKELGPLIERLSQARVVMLGECTHGTHELYEWRRIISEWLAVKHGFRESPLASIRIDPAFRATRAARNLALRSLNRMSEPRLPIKPATMSPESPSRAGCARPRGPESWASSR